MATPAIVLEELGYRIGSVESEVVAILMACTLLSLPLFLFLSFPLWPTPYGAMSDQWWPAFKGYLLRSTPREFKDKLSLSLTLLRPPVCPDLMI
jgi:hypothetical protein